MTHSRTHCARTAAAAKPVSSRFALTCFALAALLLGSAAKAQAAAPESPASPSISSATTPPSDVQQTAPPPEPPPEKVAPEPTPQGSVGPTSAAPEVTAFDITVRAPPEVREMLKRHLELQRYRAVTDLDEAEMERLIVLAERNVRNLVGTLGYFSPDIRITREGGVNQRQVIVVAVEPGQATHIGPVAISFAGDIADSPDADAMAQRHEIERDWRLPTGLRFTQDGWSGAKTQALRQLVARRYPAGKLAGSLADVDAPARIASLRVDLDSGPLYRLGPMQVSGVERYDPLLVPRLARLNQGDIYDLNQLVQAQQRLASSGYFDSAYVFINPENDPQAVPVQVQVREARLQKIVLGIGVTTDTGPRASVEHTHHRVPGIGWRAPTKTSFAPRVVR
ncbi:MAG: POTRA domain-containing protein [Polaromonas sp.]